MARVSMGTQAHPDSCDYCTGDGQSDPGPIAARRAVNRAGMAALAVAAFVAPGGAAAAEDADQRVELTQIGVAASFPADWHVLTPMQPRESWYDVSAEDETPVYAWTAIFATGGDGRWCGIDRYEEFPWTLDEHAAFLERWHVSASLYGRSGGLEAIELPSGPAWRIDVSDERKERTSRLYLLAHEQDQVLLTCSDQLGSEEDWLEIAATIELGPRVLVAPEVIAATAAARMSE